MKCSMRQLPGRAFLSVLPFLAWGANEGLAATYHWVGGTGDWDTTSPNWTGPQSTWPTAGTDNDAVFGIYGGTVAIVGGVTVDDLSFTAPGYRVVGDTLTLGSSSITIDQELSATIACEIAGVGGMTLAGPGTLSLTRSQRSATSSWATRSLRASTPPTQTIPERSTFPMRYAS
jgi:hypothetical protein